MSEQKPPTLDYSSAHPESQVGQAIVSVLVATVCFAVAHFVAEIVMQNLGAYRFGWFGADLSPWDLEDEVLFNTFVEVVWLVPASVIVFVIQGCALVLALSSQMRSGSWALALLLGLFYCLSRWGLWGVCKALDVPFSDKANFYSAMLIAALCGGVLALWRRKRVG